jgi:hypothetical protein
MGLANLGSDLETCVGIRVRLVGVPISFEKNFFRLPFTPPSLVRRIGPSGVPLDVVANMAPSAICSSLILVIHDNMINGTNHIV